MITGIRSLRRRTHGITSKPRKIRLTNQSWNLDRTKSARRQRAKITLASVIPLWGLQMVILETLTNSKSRRYLPGRTTSKMRSTSKIKVRWTQTGLKTSTGSYRSRSAESTTMSAQSINSKAQHDKIIP